MRENRKEYNSEMRDANGEGGNVTRTGLVAVPSGTVQSGNCTVWYSLVTVPFELWMELGRL